MHQVLRIHISESDRFEGRPLYEAIVARCRELGIAGATVFLGLEGYGGLADLHRERGGRPAVVIVADTAENIRRLASAVEPMMDTGLMAVSEVRMIRVEKRPDSML
jgi:PII-like signaling protein